MGRTLLQDAVPRTFGLKAAGWMVAIDEAAAVLAAVPLAVQMGGPVGHRDPATAAAVARELGLAEPLLPWHTNRLRPVALAAALGALAGVLAKPARDVTLMAEVREGVEGRGGSSAMAHKRNPVAAVSVLACARRIPGARRNHVRGDGAGTRTRGRRLAGGVGTMTVLLRFTGSAAAWSRDLLEHLEVDEAVMRAGAGEAPDLGASSQLIDRALAAHRR